MSVNEDLIPGLCIQWCLCYCKKNKKNQLPSNCYIFCHAYWMEIAMWIRINLGRHIWVKRNKLKIHDTYIYYAGLLIIASDLHASSFAKPAHMPLLCFLNLSLSFKTSGWHGCINQHDGSRSLMSVGSVLRRAVQKTEIRAALSHMLLCSSAYVWTEQGPNDTAQTHNWRSFRKLPAGFCRSHYRREDRSWTMHVLSSAVGQSNIAISMYPAAGCCPAQLHGKDPRALSPRTQCTMHSLRS